MIDLQEGGYVMHRTINPAILYFGTPVVLISTLNEDGSANLAPMSSAWWLGRRCVLGLARASKTTENLLSRRECVLNLPSIDQAEVVDRLALTTGSNPVPEIKLRRGYRHERDKFALSGLTPVAGRHVAAPRAAECPVQLEAALHASFPLAENDPQWGGRSLIVETTVKCVHVDEDIRLTGHENRIDPDRWRPLIMSFQQFYGLGDRTRYSTLSQVPEEMYRAAPASQAGYGPDDGGR
jgi:flavin reductase (DIM6/NTAB) family NADH-FMN oxidoreductase RutF